MYISYGDITLTQLSDNDAQMSSPYDPNQPIESLYKQIDSAVAFAASTNNDYTAKHMVNVAYDILF